MNIFRGGIGGHQAASEEPPCESSHCRNLTVANGSDRLQCAGQPISVSHSKTVGNKLCVLSILQCRE